MVSWDIGDNRFFEEGRDFDVVFAKDETVDCCGIGTVSPSKTVSGKTRVNSASC